MRRPNPRDIDRVASSLRARRVGRLPGASVGAGSSFGAGVVVRVEEGGRLQIGLRVEIGAQTEIIVGAGATVVIDNDVFIGRLGIIAARDSLFIGRGTMLAELVSVRDHDHDPDFPPSSGRFLVEPGFIGRDVWIGGKSSIVRRGSVEDGSIIGAHSLVNRLVPTGSVAAGVPAVVLRKRAEPT